MSREKTLEEAREWVECVRAAHARWVLAAQSAYQGSHTQVWPHCEFAWVGDELFLTTNMNARKAKPLLVIARSSEEFNAMGHCAYLRGDGPFHKLRSVGTSTNSLDTAFFGIGDLLRQWDEAHA